MLPGKEREACTDFSTLAADSQFIYGTTRSFHTLIHDYVTSIAANCLKTRTDTNTDTDNYIITQANTYFYVNTNNQALLFPLAPLLVESVSMGGFDDTIALAGVLSN